MTTTTKRSAKSESKAAARIAAKKAKRASKPKVLTAGQKAAQTKGADGLRLAALRASLTRMMNRKDELRGKERTALLAMINDRKAEIARLA